MSMMKRIFALLLTVAMLACALTACNQPNTPQETTPVGTTEVPETTTPEEVTTPAEPEIPTTPPQKITSFYVTSGKSAVETFAATELKWYLAEKNLPLSPDGYHISIVIDEQVVKDGYTIIAYDENGLTIAGGNNRGLAYGIYDFLEKYIGVHFYAPDTIVVDDEDVMIGGGVLEVFDPAFEILRNPWQPIEKLAEKDGGNTAELGSTKVIALNTIAGTGSVTTCLSDSKNFEKALEKVRLQLNGNVDAVRFSPVTEYDAYCTCDKCARVHEEEGSPAGIYIRFLNKLYEAVVAEYPGIQFEITPRAYLSKAPSVTKPVDGVWIRFDNDKCHISHSVTDPNCPEAVAFCESIQSWGTFCDNVYVEYALTAYKDFLPVFANLGAMREDICYFAECGVDSIRFTGNIVCPTGEFGELRVYLLSKLLQNPMMSEEEYYGYMDAFLKSFYGEGWQYIRQFIDKIIELAADGHQTKKDSPFAAITEEEYLANEGDFDEWWNRAESLAGERAEFVKRARYQWRYIKLCLHPNAEDAQALITDAAGGQRVAWRDKQWNVDTARSNLNLAPTEWVYKS